MYQQSHSLDSRRTESERIRKKYPDRIPVIMEKCRSSTMNTLQQSKFLVPDSITVSQLIYVIRKKVKLGPQEALFVFIHDSLPNSAMNMKEIYELHKENDGFLYLLYSNENTFG